MSAGQAALALLLLLSAVCFLSISLALRGSQFGATIPLLLAVAFGVSWGVAQMAVTRRIRKAVLIVGTVLLTGCVAIVAYVLAAWHH